MESVKSFVKSLSKSSGSKSGIKDKKKYLSNFFKKEDLQHIKKDGLDLFVLPKQYYIWKGINTTHSKNKNVDIDSKDTKKILDNISSYFFADKDTASLYGTANKYDKEPGVDLQFKIIEDIVLLDISSLNTVRALFKYIKNLTIEDVKKNSYLSENYKKGFDDWNKYASFNKKYPTEELFFEKKWKVKMRELITDTIGNYDPKRTSTGKIGSPKTPIKVERKSDEIIDKDLVKLICGITNSDYNGWIYFKMDDSGFHDEIMICNPYGYIEYIDYHKI